MNTNLILQTHRSDSSDQPSPRNRERFVDALQTRDHGCVFTGCTMCIARHLIPFRQWTKMSPDLTRVGFDDMRNGITLRKELNQLTRQGNAAILCTNDILTDDDIPQPRIAHYFRETARERNLIIPRNPPSSNEKQYVLQYFILEPDKKAEIEYFAQALQNTRADFANSDRKLYPLPDPRICEYLYGRAVLARFWNEHQSTRWNDLVRWARSQSPSSCRHLSDSPSKLRNFFDDADAYLTHLRQY
ncbi:hypothetical protein VKT23_018189 [Stygiomarasmius scandens]|uniref:HNH nuclease domain-containing protein n=1 Tax=Marasmiellus scandens TaxID=2682957 RepID=A0ABR1IPK6_9AGAR